MTDINIPPEAVETSCRAKCEVMGIDPDEPLPEEVRVGPGPWPYWTAFVDEQRAAIRAALAAWPGAEPLRRKNGQGRGLFLPLPQEPRT